MPDEPSVAELAWIDARELAVEGRAWDDTEEFYDRLPRRARGVVRDPVWDLSRDSAGLAVHFAGATPALRARWTLRRSQLAMTHMPASGVSGLDLYFRDAGAWRWLAAVRPDAGVEAAGVLFERVAPARREYLLYLPLYNGLRSLQLGVPRGCRLEPVVRRERPLVFYGTSILQGACVSRPGLAYPALLGRRLDRPVVNLGFSSNGKAEPEMAELLAGLDPAMYVLDCMPNLRPDEVARVGPLVDTLRARHPALPIVLVENLEYPGGILIPLRQEYRVTNPLLREIHARRRGDPHLHLLSARDLLGHDGEATTDGVHPNDLGAMRMAERLEPHLRRALG
ncbi:MAG: SGNH/GDSL hydrolase family protein [Opitutaceae bacterium]|nr:SGNH/GDSL hydrolase family protein [Opitutaceae bacterium]